MQNFNDREGSYVINKAIDLSFGLDIDDIKWKELTDLILKAQQEDLWLMQPCLFPHEFLYLLVNCLNWYDEMK